MKRIWLFVFLILSAGVVNAADGCLIDNTTVYPTKVTKGLLNVAVGALFGSSNLYYNTSGSYSECGWTPATTGVSCAICEGTYDEVNVLGIQLISGCSGIIKQGYQGVGFNIVNCNLDDYTWTFGAAAGLFGIFVIRRRNKP